MTQNDGSVGGLHRQRPVQSLHKPAFELTGFGRGADFAEHDRILAELAANPVEAGSLPDSGLLVALAVDAPTELSLKLGAHGEDLIDDARAGIAAGDHENALALVEEYLERFPTNQEARFLRAYCLSHLKEPRYEEALRILRPLRDEQTSEDLGRRVSDLRRELRRRLAPGEYKAYADKAARDPKGALARVGEFFELVPEEGKLCCLLVLGHARLGDLDKALDTAEYGLAEADSDRGRLQELTRRLRLIRLRPIAEPAARAFKAGDPQLARTLLGGIDARWRTTGPIRDFERYLALVIEHANPPVPPAPLLPDDRTDDLYSLIAETDVSRALELMDHGALERAERLLAALMAAVPGFAWLNFVYAICLYRRARRPDLAEACARVALRDPTIGQARDLLAAIHAWQEAIVINPVVDEFIAVTDALQALTGPHQLPPLRSRLVDLRRRIPVVRQAARTAEGRQVVEEVAAAIGGWLAELDKAEQVNLFFEEYERVMATAAGGLKNVQQADRLAASLDALGARISAARTRTGTGTGQGRADPLDELAGRVRARRTETDQARTAIEVSDTVRRFNELMTTLSASPSAEVYRAVGTAAKTLGRDALRLRNAAGRTLIDRDRQLLDQLIGTIGRLWP